MDSYTLTLIIAGVSILGAAWFPRLIKERPLSLPILYVGIGFLIWKLPLGFDAPNPLQQPFITERLTELMVIISLTGAGLTIDRRPTWAEWKRVLPLLLITMPLSIAAVGFLGWWALGLAPASAMLLGAVLAPTDPVLASDVQVGPPRKGEEDETRFSLTLEAGLNDGLGFPFTYLAIAMATMGLNPASWVGEWFLDAVLYKIVVGVLAGLIVGLVLARFIFRLPEHSKLASSGDGLVALAITLLAYGVTELVHGYGFLAVFVAATTLRHYERWHEYHERLHEFTEQTERLFMVLLLALFGGALAAGLLNALTWEAVLVGLLFIFVIRPLTGFLALARSQLPLREKATISFFGIRGIGSIYYLAFALNHADFAKSELLWASTAFVILASLLIHGTTATPVMQYLDRVRKSETEVKAVQIRAPSSST